MYWFSIALTALQILLEAPVSSTTEEPLRSNLLIPISEFKCVLGISFQYELFPNVLRTEDLSVEEGITFKLYTREVPAGESIEVGNVGSLKASSFKAERPNRIITHGFLGDGEKSCAWARESFLEKGDFNIIIMDWLPFQLSGPSAAKYKVAAERTKDAGEYLAKMIDFLESQGMDLTTTQLIGHSLGAHVVGIAGFNAKNEVEHIVGLDPALPRFEHGVPGRRISRRDAKTVEIIHTNGGACGIMEAIGHYDFYVNGGKQQPGCPGGCSHKRVVEYFAESITSDVGFYGSRCDDIENITKDKCVGEEVSLNDRSRGLLSYGSYYLETNEEPPYAKGRAIE